MRADHLLIGAVSLDFGQPFVDQRHQLCRARVAFVNHHMQPLNRQRPRLHHLDPVTDAQLKAEYDGLKSKMGGTEYKARHILVETEDQAKAIIENLKKGAKFEELAKQSKDPGSKENGGEAGWSAAGAYVPPFAEALTKLAKGKYTEAPVKTDFGWHVIQLEDSRPLEAPAFESLKSQLSQRANQQLVEKMIEGLRTKAKVQ